MALETGTYINSLVATNPASNDPQSQGDDHIRLTKATLLATFPNITNAVTPTHAELNYVDGVTSPIQTQLDAKAPIDSPVFTGTPLVPTADTGTTGAQAASLNYVIATALAGTLPGQTGNAGKLMGTNGTNASWVATLDPTVIKLTGAGDIVGTTGTQTLTGKTLLDPKGADGADSTKKLNWNLAGISTATTRTITPVDENIKLFTGHLQYIGKVSASNSASVDIEMFTSEFDDYVIECNNLVQSTGSDKNLLMRVKSTTPLGYSNVGYTSQLLNGSVAALSYHIIQDTMKSGALHIAPFVVRLFNVHSAASHCWFSDVAVKTNYTVLDAFRGSHSNATPMLGVQFLLSSGNLASGDIKIYGVRKV